MKQTCFLLLTLSALYLVQGQQHQPFPSSLPNQFITEIEANILNRGYTLQVTEYFDSPNDRSRIETLRNGSRHVVVHDYNSQITYIADTDARTCQASNATSGRMRNPFQTVGSDGLAHLVSVNDFFQIGKKYHDKYVGVASVRGIQCDQYMGSYANTTGNFTYNYTMQWYFAKRENWTMPLGNIAPNSAIPVRLALVGTSNFPTRRPGQPRGPPMPGPVHSFSHIYDFVNFRTGSLASMTPDLFNPPALIFCTGLPIVKALPAIPSQFSMASTVTVAANSSSFSSLYAYDALRQQTSTLFDYEADGTQNLPSFVFGRHHIIHNFREGTQYNITNTTCTMERLSELNFAFDSSVTNGHASLVSPNTVFQFTTSYNWTYQGSRVIRGIAAESWIAVRNDVQLVRSLPMNQSSLWEYYFSKPVWKYNSLHGRIQNIQLPVGARGRSLVPGLEDDFIMEYTITNFVLGPPSDFLVFADTVCFTAEQQETITFVLGTDYNNRHVLREPLRRQLASTMNVTIDRFHMDLFPAPDNQLTVLVRVHDVPTVGDPSLLRLLTTRKNAVSSLKKSVQRGRLSVTAPGVAVSRAVSGSYSSSAESKQTTFSAGEMAGLAVGVLILGLVIGAGIVYVYKRYQSDAVPYKVQ